MPFTKRKSLYFWETKTYEPKEQIELYGSSAMKDLNTSVQSCFDFVCEFTGFITQKKRTKELSKQINAKMRALDVQSEEYKEQTRIRLQEYAIQLNEKIKQQRDLFQLEIQKELAECEQQCREQKISFQQYMLKSASAQKTLTMLGEQLESIRQLLEMAKEDSANSNKYYLLLSEQYRLSWKNYTKIAELISQ